MNDTHGHDKRTYQELLQENNLLHEKIKSLETQLHLLRHKLYGKSSEQIDPEQQSLFEEDEDHCEDSREDTKKETITYTRKKPGRPQKNLDTSQLPREVVIHDLSKAEKQCACGGLLQAMGKDIKR